MIRRPPRSTHCISSAASDVYKRQEAHFTEEVMSDLYCYAQNKKEKKDQEETYPLSYQEMGKAQSKDKSLLKKVASNPKLYSFKKSTALEKSLN